MSSTIKKLNKIQNFKSFSKKKKNEPKKIRGLVHIKFTNNNTISTLTDLKGNTKGWVSAGTVGFDGARRSSKFAGESVVDRLIFMIKKLRYKSIIMHLKGRGKARNLVTVSYTHLTLPTKA